MNLKFQISNLKYILTAPSPPCPPAPLLPGLPHSPLALAGVKSKLTELGVWLTTFGAFGLFTIALLDSALIPLPSGPDLILITLSAANPEWMPLYALAATAGSTVGCTILYLLARRAGVAALRRVKPQRRERIENLLGRYDMLALIVPAILPPPFPFKPFVLSAGVFKLRLARFIAAIFIGRAVRYLIEGWLAVRFGDDAVKLIKQNGLKVVLAVLIVFLLVFVVKFYRRRAQQAAMAADEMRPPA